MSNYIVCMRLTKNLNAYLCCFWFYFQCVCWLERCSSGKIKKQAGNACVQEQLCCKFGKEIIA